MTTPYPPSVPPMPDLPPGRWVSVPPQPPGRHDCMWTVVGVQPVLDGPGGPDTSALLRCTGSGLSPACGIVHTEYLAGTWTLAQVRGEELQSSTPPAGD